MDKATEAYLTRIYNAASQLYADMYPDRWASVQAAMDTEHMRHFILFNLQWAHEHAVTEMRQLSPN